MDRTRKILLSELAGSCLLTVLLVAMFETGLLLPGGWAGADSGTVVTLQFLMQFLTLSVIPLALFLFRTGPVRRDLRNGGQQVSRRLLFWGSVRMMLLCAHGTQSVLLLCLWRPCRVLLSFRHSGPESLLHLSRQETLYARMSFG